jgi:hypothetical protein
LGSIRRTSQPLNRTSGPVQVRFRFASGSEPDRGNTNSDSEAINRSLTITLAILCISLRTSHLAYPLSFGSLLVLPSWRYCKSPLRILILHSKTPYGLTADRCAVFPECSSSQQLWPTAQPKDYDQAGRPRSLPARYKVGEFPGRRASNV